MSTSSILDAIISDPNLSPMFKSALALTTVIHGSSLPAGEPSNPSTAGTSRAGQDSVSIPAGAGLSIRDAVAAVPVGSYLDPRHHRDDLRVENARLLVRLARTLPPRWPTDPDETDFVEFGEWWGAFLRIVKDEHERLCRFAGMHGGGNLDVLIEDASAAFSDIISDFVGTMAKIGEAKTREREEEMV